MTSAPLGGITIELRFDSRLPTSAIASSRRFVQELYEPIIGPDASSRVAMVVHELMENLSKYGAEAPVQLRIEFLPVCDRGNLSITATNRSTPERLRELTRILDELSSTGDPRATYLSYMNSSVKRVEGSCLGLVRIRVEGEMQISYRLSDGGVSVRAEASLPLEMASWEPS